MTALRVAIVGFGKIARDQHVPAIAATDGVTLAAVASRNASLPDLPHFTTLEAVVARRPADRCRCSLHAAAGAARAGGGGARGRQACDAGEAAGRERQRTRSPDCGGCARRTDAVRDLAFTLCARGRAGAAMACVAPHQFRAHRLEGGRSRLASGAGLDLGAGRAWRLRSRHQRALDPHKNPAAAAVRDGGRAFFPGQSRGAHCRATFRSRIPKGVPITAEFDFRQTGPQSWDIVVDTDRGPLTLSGGGARLVAGRRGTGRSGGGGISRALSPLYRVGCDGQQRRRPDAASPRRGCLPARPPPDRRKL